jgi:hypothetical protein
VTTSLHASRVVGARARALFAVLARPARHVELDLTGMLRGAVDPDQVLTEVGQIFAMRMYNPLKGDHVVENHVVVCVPGRALGWAPAEPGAAPAGHTFVWTFDPLDDGHTRVTQTYDWSAFTHVDMLAHLPVVDADQLRASVDRLAALVA